MCLHGLAYSPASLVIPKRHVNGDSGQEIRKVEIPLRKPRFLCLHGFRTSGEILKKQLRRWPASVLDRLDLDFPNAPYPCRGKSDVEGFYDPPYYEWFNFSISQFYQDYYLFEECLAYLEDYMVNHGPFDGLLGFSQGAILSAALPGMQSEGLALTKVEKIKSLILVAAAKFGGSRFVAPKLAAKAFSSKIRCPSVHVIGETDFFKEPGEELVESFEDPLVVYHPLGHTIARLDEKGHQTMLTFIEKIEKILLLHDLSQDHAHLH